MALEIGVGNWDWKLLTSLLKELKNVFKSQASFYGNINRYDFFIHKFGGKKYTSGHTSNAEM